MGGQSGKRGFHQGLHLLVDHTEGKVKYVEWVMYQWSGGRCRVWGVNH
jgi:hypothetical protein